MMKKKNEPVKLRTVLKLLFSRIKKKPIHQMVGVGIYQV